MLKFGSRHVDAGMFSRGSRGASPCRPGGTVCNTTGVTSLSTTGDGAGPVFIN